ncbi:MAG: hypothetical protein IH877_02600 [Gemmatimonadetes bacterium]|nr:hypothetical protein [Gemmatimonadota bacterium]
MDTPTADSASVGERFYRLLLRLYPASFRRHYGAEMVDLFAHRYADALGGWGGRGGGGSGRVAFWSRTAVDVFCNALPLRAAALARAHRKVGVTAAAGGGTVAMTVGSACLCVSHLAAFFGVATVGAAAVVWSYRPQLLVISFVMLAIAFIAAHASAGSLTADTKLGSRRFGRMAVWVATLAWMFAFYAPDLTKLLHH